MKIQKLLLFASIYLLLFSNSYSQEINIDSFRSIINAQKDANYFDSLSFQINDIKSLNKFEKAEIIALAVQRTDKLGLNFQKAKFLYRLSILKTIDGKYNQALKLIEKIIPIFEKNKDYLYLGACYNSSGGILSIIGDKNGGIERLKKAISFAQRAEVDDLIKRRSMSNHYNVLGTIYFKNKEYQKAQKYFELTNEFAIETTSYGSTERCYSLLNLSHTYIKKGQYNEAIKLGNESLEQAKVSNHPDLICYAYHRIGLALNGLEKSDTALYYFQLMEQTAIQNKYSSLAAKAQFQQSKIYKQKGSSTLAFTKFKQYSEQQIKEEKEKNEALTNFLINETKKRDQAKARTEIAQEKIKQRNLQLFLAITIGLLLLLLFGLFYWLQKKKLKQKIKDEQTKIDLMQSQIRTIGSQMNPHFVFNALNSVQDLILQKDVRGSSIYLAKFADLMRNTLEASQKNEIDLEKEIEILELYLSLEALRFDNTDFEYHIISEEVRDKQFRIPAMFIQPYVENAIKHGLLHKTGKKEINVVFKQTPDELTCIITDNGIGRAKAGTINERRQEKHKSFSTNANQERLHLINKSTDKHIKLEITDLMDEHWKASGTQVVICFKEAELLPFTN